MMNLEGWELILYIGLGLFSIDAIYIIWRGFRHLREFNAYLEANHTAAFHQLVYQNGGKKFFLPPWHKESFSYFIASSREDFGDPQIAAYRTKLRWDLYSFIINAIAAVVFFVIVALWFEYVVWR
jgi:hypothetical protein